MASSPPKKNTAFTFYVFLTSQANTKIHQANPTLASGDVKVAIDDGAPANLGTLPVVDADFTKRVKVVLAQAEMNGDRISVLFSDASGAEWCDLGVDIATSVRQIDDISTQTSVDDLPTNAELATSQASADDATLAAIAALNNLSAAQVNAEVDTALADYDAPTFAELDTRTDAIDAAIATRASQASVDDLPTNAELATSQASADDATLAAIAALNNLSAAQVNAEVDTALTDYDGPTNAELATALAAADDAVLAAVAGRASQTSVDDLPTNAELATALGTADDAVLSAINALNDPSLTEIAEAVWEEDLSDHSGVVGSTAEALGAAGSAGDPWSTALPGLYGSGSAGKIIGDNVNATISSRATQISVDDLPTNAELATSQAAADDATLAAIAALNNLSAAQVNSEVDTAISDAALATAANLATVAGYLDTEIAAILAAVDTEVAAALAAVDTEVAAIAVQAAAIKVVTDALTAAGAAKLALSANTIVSGAAAAGTLTTTAMTTNLTEATSDHYNGRIIIWTSGVLQNQATDITDYDGTTKVLTYTAVTEAPSALDTFIIV